MGIDPFKPEVLSQSLGLSDTTLPDLRTNLERQRLVLETLETKLPIGDALSAKERIEIRECGDPLVEIDPSRILRVDPHPYASRGAPYGDASPFHVRSEIAERLYQAQNFLDHWEPGFRLIVYDALRPTAVQSYMVEDVTRELASRDGVDIGVSTGEVFEKYRAQALQVWAPPNENPKTPPPHSTGAVIDLLIVDQNGDLLDFGAEFDEPSDRIHPNYYRGNLNSDAKLQHHNRRVLNMVMEMQGFVRLSHEFWHFSHGDQFHALVETLATPGKIATARYGRADLIGQNIE